MSKGTTSNKKATADIPAPFEPASAKLKPLLEQCDPAKVYLFHIDRLDVPYKKGIFAIPVVLNGTIGVLLLWRLYVIAPTYLALLLSIFGIKSSVYVDNATITRRQQFFLVLRRASLIFLDYLLFRLVGPWPITFFTERPANPVTWRWKLGFHTKEVIARVSRGWSAADLIGGVKKGGESPFFKTRVITAIDKECMAKTGYLQMDRSWDLDFQVMLDAHHLIKQKKFELDDVDCIACVHMEGDAGWCQWRWQTPSRSDQVLEETVARLRAEAAQSS